MVLVDAYVKVEAKPNEAGRWALLIGVDDYTDLTKLRFAGNDQRALAEQLIASGFPEDQVFVMHDKADQNRYRPFRENIEKQLQLILGMANRGDLVIVSFSGHGVQLDDKSYLCPADAQLERLEATSIAMDDVYNRLAKSRATLKLLVVDACRNDMVPVGRRSVALARSMGEFAGTKERPPEGIMLLASCGPSQVSMEDADFQHGVFMHYLLEGLQGKAANSDGAVTLAGLYDFASLQTKKYVTRKFNDSQTPALKGEINGPFEICRRITPKSLTNSIGMKLALIPAGEFMMGSPEDEKDRQSDEGPKHRVRITKPFYMGVHEVTVGQFRQFVADANYKTEAEQDGKGGYGYDGKSWQQKPEYTWRNPGFPQSDDHPVVNVSWNDAVAFCQWTSRKEGKSYRLPTEAQWEYACRAGTATPFSFGSVCNGREANFYGNYPYGPEEKGPYLERTTTVGSYRPNAFGLYDMHGNVWEWCADWVDSSYYAASPTDNPTGPTSGSLRVVRGGGWYDRAGGCRSADRGSNSPEGRNRYLGFRVSLVVEK